MKPTFRLTALAVVAAGLAACASPAELVSPSGVAFEAPYVSSVTDTAPSAALDAPAAGASAPRSDLFAAAASIGDSTVGSDGATGPTAAPVPQEARDEWRFSFTPYLWWFSIDGKVKGKNGSSFPVSTTLHDTYNLVKDHIDPSLTGHFEATDGTLTFFLDGQILNFSGDGSATFTGPRGNLSLAADLDVDLGLNQAEAGATYLVGEFCGNAKRNSRVELLGGARWNSIEVDTHFKVSGKRVDFDNKNDFSSGWVDPFVGARTRIPLSETVDFTLRGDIGGGLGDGCESVWNVVTGLAWKVSECTSVVLVWRWYDFERNSGGRETNLQLHGPGLGVTILF